MEVLYQPANDAERDCLADFFVRAEELFFSCWNPVRDRSLPEELSDGVEQVFQWSEVRPDKAVPGEIFLEPLFGVGPGFPCYLTVHFDPRAGREKCTAGQKPCSSWRSGRQACGKPSRSCAPALRTF